MAIGLSALNDIEWQRTLKECLITGRICHSARVTSECHSLPFSEQSERMSFCYAKKENITNKVKHKSNRNYEIYSIKFGIIVVVGDNR